MMRPILFIYVIAASYCAPMAGTFQQKLALSKLNFTDVLTQFIWSIPADESQCFAKLQHAVNNFISDPTVLNLIVYSGKNMNDLGMYQECHQSNQSTYILLSVSTLIYLGICSPKECNETFYNDHKAVLLDIVNKISPIAITLDSIEFYNSEDENTSYMHISWYQIVWISVFIFVFLFCIYAYVVTHKLSEEELKNRKGMKFLQCFNIGKNISTIFYSENKVDKNLDVINGVKTLSCGWVVTGHVFLFIINAPITNLTYMIDFLGKSVMFTVITGATVSVDVFFVFAGFLSGMGITKLFSNPNNRTIKNVLLLYIKRYIRLLPIYAALFLLARNFLPLFGSGPLYFKCFYIGWVNCESYWWRNLLYINNLFSGNMCLSWTWYISNDMQFFIITPWIIWIYSKSKISGALIAFAVYLFSIGSNIYLTIKYNLSISLTDLTGIGLSDYFDKLYMKPWARINTYIIGIFIAWLYLAAKDSKYSTKVYDAINSALKSVYIRYIVYILGFLLLNYCLFVYEVFNTDYKNVTRLMTVLYISLSRSGFVIGMMMIIYPVMIGHGKPLLSVLGYQLFNSIAKYTYGIYMLHLLIFAFSLYTTVQGIEFSALFLFTRSGDIFMSGILLGLLGTLMFDSPLLNIEKIYLFPEAPRRQITITQEMKTLVNK